MIDFDLEVLPLHRQAVDTDEAHTVGGGAEGEILGEIELVRRPHDGQTEVEVVDHDAHGARFSRIVDHVATAVELPVGALHADEGVEIRRAEGDELDLGRRRAGRRNGDPGREGDAEARERLRRNRCPRAAGHCHRLHRSLVEGKRAGDEHELRHLDRGLRHTGVDLPPGKIKEQRVGRRSGPHRIAGYPPRRCRGGEAGGEIDGGIVEQRACPLDDRAAEIEIDLDLLGVDREHPSAAIGEARIRHGQFGGDERGKLGTEHRLEDPQCQIEVADVEADSAGVVEPLSELRRISGEDVRPGGVCHSGGGEPHEGRGVRDPQRHHVDLNAGDRGKVLAKADRQKVFQVCKQRLEPRDERGLQVIDLLLHLGDLGRQRSVNRRLHRRGGLADARLHRLRDCRGDPFDSPTGGFVEEFFKHSTELRLDRRDGPLDEAPQRTSRDHRRDVGDEGIDQHRRHGVDDRRCRGGERILDVASDGPLGILKGRTERGADLRRDRVDNAVDRPIHRRLEAVDSFVELVADAPLD